MIWLACALILSVASCVVDETPPEPGGPPVHCDIDDDCLMGDECENAWCRDDGTCRIGTATGLDCGVNGMCVENKCIER